MYGGRISKTRDTLNAIRFDMNLGVNTVAIQVLSDLHLEVERAGVGQPGLYEFDFPAHAENLAILGDLGSTNDDRFFEWLDIQLRRFRRVFFVPGNHEPYWTSLVLPLLLPGFSLLTLYRCARRTNQMP